MPSTYEYEFLEGVERLDKYRPGGYHPVQVRDILGDRHKVVHKLGYGGYSTTWLCQDRHTGEYVAVKVATAYSDPREPEIMSFLNCDCSSTANHPGRAMIPLIQDQFILQGPNGIHACYSTVPASCSLSDAKDGSYKRIFQIETARSLIAQLVLAIDYVHKRGVIHGGKTSEHPKWFSVLLTLLTDIHLGNIFIRMPRRMHKLTTQELYEKYGAPFVEPVIRLDRRPLMPGIPVTALPPVWLGKPSEEFIATEAKLMLKDFGEAYSPYAEVRNFSNTIMSFVPPESIFEARNGLSFPADIWTMACAIWAIMAQRPLFEEGKVGADGVTAEQMDVLGEFPLDWWNTWQSRHEYFDDSGFPVDDREMLTLEERLEKRIQKPRLDAGFTGMEADEKIAFMDMMRSMLKFRPEERSRTPEILECDWIVKWAMPQFKSSKLPSVLV